MYTSGQTINYEKYIDILNTMPAPILGSQLPDAQLDLTGLMEYARERGVKAGSLSDEEKNLFIKGGTVSSLRKEVEDSIQYKNVAEWNAAREREAASA